MKFKILGLAFASLLFNVSPVLAFPRPFMPPATPCQRGIEACFYIWGKVPADLQAFRGRDALEWCKRTYGDDAFTARVWFALVCVKHYPPEGHQDWEDYGA